jgi:hypothetical protein
MQSHAEVATARWLRESGFPAPVAQMAVEGPDRRRWFVDFGWPAFRVVLEVDSFAHHHGPRKLSRDHERRSAIEAAGWRVLSTTVAEIERGGAMLKAALTLWLRDSIVNTAGAGLCVPFWVGNCVFCGQERISFRPRMTARPGPPAPAASPTRLGPCPRRPACSSW